MSARAVSGVQPMRARRSRASTGALPALELHVAGQLELLAQPENKYNEGLAELSVGHGQEALIGAGYWGSNLIRNHRKTTTCFTGC